MSLIYEKLREALRQQAEAHQLADGRLNISCRDLSATEAIGNPEDRDYPIIKGREKMVEANFEGARGQAFSDEYGNSEYLVRELLEKPLRNNRDRADFIAAFNAIYRHLGLCGQTVHCRDHEPRLCAAEAARKLGSGQKILLVGLQPRFLEFLSQENQVRVVDLDQENIGTRKFGVTIEPPENTASAITWCDTIFATGSTVVNDTIDQLLGHGRPLTLYGVSAAGPALVLGLETFCHHGH